MGDPRTGRRQISSPTLITSFHYAWLGLRICWLTQRNFRIHVCLAWLALGAAVFIPLPALQLLVVLMIISMVLLAELFNTALEWLLDYLVPEYSALVGHIKDVVAAGVLVTSLVAAIVGLSVFGPVIPRFPALVENILGLYPFFAGSYLVLTVLVLLVSLSVPIKEL